MRKQIMFEMTGLLGAPCGKPLSLQQMRARICATQSSIPNASKRPQTRRSVTLPLGLNPV